MIRTVVFSSLFGAGAGLDAFYTAFRIPNLLRDLFAEGALSQAYTSVAAKERERSGDEEAWALTNKVFTLLSALMLIIVTLGIIFSGSLMDVLYTDSPSESMMTLATNLCRIMWPFILFASLSALTMGALNIIGVFGLPMLASAAFNIVTVVVGLLICYIIDPTFGANDPDSFKTNALYGFSIAVVLGGAAQWLVQLPRLKNAGFKWRINPKWRDPNIYKICALMLPSVFASGTTQFNVLINNIFALSVSKGSVTSLTNAFQLWQLPVGLFGVATGMVVLPAVSRMMVGDGRGEVAEHIAKALRFVAFFAIPSFVMLSVLGEQCISVVFQWGRFDATAVQYTGSILASYSIGLLGYAGIKIVQPVFLALEKRWTPLIIAVISLTVSVGLNYLFVRIWHKDASWLALTTSVITTMNFCIYLFLLRRHLGTLCGGVLLSGFLKTAVAGCVFALVAYLGKEWLLQGFTSWNVLTRFSMFALVSCLGVGSYLAAAWVLRIPELEAFKKQIAKRLLSK